MFSKLYKFSKFVMYLNSCSMDLGRDRSSFESPFSIIIIEREREINWHILGVFNEDVKCSNPDFLIVTLELSRERERNNWYKGKQNSNTIP